MRDKKNLYRFVTVITVFIMAFFYYLFEDAKLGMKKFEREFGIERAEIARKAKFTDVFSLT